MAEVKEGGRNIINEYGLWFQSLNWGCRDEAKLMLMPYFVQLKLAAVIE